MRNEKESDMGTQAWAHRVVALRSVGGLPVRAASSGGLLNDWVGTYIYVDELHIGRGYRRRPFRNLVAQKRQSARSKPAKNTTRTTQTRNKHTSHGPNPQNAPPHHAPIRRTNYPAITGLLVKPIGFGVGWTIGQDSLQRFLYVL